MIEFKKVEISDKQWMDKLLAQADLAGCHQNFTNIFAWAEIYDYRVACVHGFLVVKGASEYGIYYFYPTGEGDIRLVMEEMKQDAADCGHPFVLAGVSPENIEVLDNVYPDLFKYEEIRDSFDYVYLLESLATLAGRKYQAKRNHINRFKANQEWSYEQITADNLAECWKMNKEWCIIHDCNEDEDLANEKCAVTRCFDYYHELGLEGGLLRVEGRVIGFTMGEKLNSDTYVTHIEKAFGEIQGSYQMINQQFAIFIKEKYPEIIYVNREEDMGLDGLRKAKKSYKPDKMEEKYLAKYQVI